MNRFLSVSLFAFLPILQAQTLSCDSLTASATAAGGTTIRFDLILDEPQSISLSGCGSDVDNSIQIIDASDGTTVLATCDAVSPPCDDRCFAPLEAGMFFVDVTNEVATDDSVVVDLMCDDVPLTPTTSAALDMSTSLGFPSSTDSMDFLDMSTTDDSMDSFESTMDMSTTSGMGVSDSSLDSGSGSSDSQSGSDSDDNDSGSQDDSSKLNQDSSYEDDEISLQNGSKDSADNRNGRSDVFEAEKKGGLTSSNAFWTCLWIGVALFAMSNVAICYCLFKGVKFGKKGTGFEKVHTEEEMA